MKHRFLLALLGIPLVLIIYSCESIYKCPECFTPPEPMLLSVKSAHDSTDLVYNGFYDADTIAIYFFDGSKKKHLELEVFTDSIQEISIIGSTEIGWTSSGGAKTFYLYLSAHEIDTIFLDVREASNDCCTYFEWLSFEINGNVVEQDKDNYWYNYFK